MRLHLILPRVEPKEIKPPSECPYEGCNGTRFQFIQEVEKPLRDTKYPQVVAHRYQCLRCFRTHLPARLRLPVRVPVCVRTRTGRRTQTGSGQAGETYRRRSGPRFW